MNKILSLVLLVALLTISLGAAVVPASATATSPDPTGPAGGQIIEDATAYWVWPVVLNDYAGWNYELCYENETLGGNFGPSVELSVPEEEAEAAVEVLISDLTMGDIDFYDEEQINFYGYSSPSIDDEESDPAAYLSLYCDSNANGISDYSVKFDMVPVEGEDWFRYLIGNHWQVITDNGTYDYYYTGDPDQDMGSDNFTEDAILGAAISTTLGNISVDALTLGTCTYNLGTIQQAIDVVEEGGQVVVFPGRYHDEGLTEYKYDEFLTIDKSVTVKSYAEYNGETAADTAQPVIQPVTVPLVTDGSDNYTQIVWICESDVTLAGFRLENNPALGDANPNLGIIAVQPEEGISLSNVEIDNNTVVIDSVANALGIAVVDFGGDSLVTDNRIYFDDPAVTAFCIEMYGCDNVYVSGNTLDIDGAAEMMGVYLAKCDYVEVESNTITFTDSLPYAFGIWCEDSGKVLANSNSIDITIEYSSGYIYSEGIYFDTVDRIQANANKVTIQGTGYFGELEGIGIWNEEWYDAEDASFERAQINSNEIAVGFANPVEEVSSELLLDEFANVYLFGIWAAQGERFIASDNTISLESDAMGAAYMEGLNAYKIYTETILNDNTVDVTGEVLQGDIEYAVESTSGRHPVSIAGDSAKFDILGIADTLFDAAAEAYGIKVEYSDNSVIDNNTVSVDLLVANIETPAENSTAVTSTVLTMAVGVEAWGSSQPQITDNDVIVFSTINAISENESEIEGTVQANGAGIALGIFAATAPSAYISGNRVLAESDGRAEAAGIPILTDNLVVDTLQSAFLDNLNSTVLEVEGQFTDSVQPQIDMGGTSTALFGLIGVGILAYNTSSLEIYDNDPVIGVVEGRVYTLIADDEEEDLDIAAGASLGLGGGILLINCGSSIVAYNGAGLYDELDVEALQSDELLDDVYGVRGYAYLTNSAISEQAPFIYEVISAGANAGISFGILDLDVSDLIEQTSTASKIIAENGVLAFGYSRSLGEGLSTAEDPITAVLNVGLRLGIGFLGTSALIEDNLVTVTDLSMAISGTFNDSDFDNSTDVMAVSANLGLALGIVTYCEDGADIIGNTVSGYMENEAVTYVLESDDLGIFDTEAIGGQLTAGIGILMIGGDNQTVESNIADVSTVSYLYSYTETNYPLEVAAATNLEANLASGLVLIATQDTVANYNSFAAAAETEVSFHLRGTFLDYSLTGIHLDLDVLTYGGSVDFNYNDVGDVPAEEIESQSSSIVITGYVCGLLNLGSQLNARYNYWGSPTGPSGEGDGYGYALINLSETDVPYSWWLSHPVADLLEDNVGYYGFSQTLEAGWNTLSVPMALEYSRWSDIVEMSDLDYSIAFAYDPTEEYAWQQVLEDDPETEIDESYVLEPLDGLYVKMKTAGTVFFTSSGTPSVPIRDLPQGQSWYLVGVTPCDDDYPFTTDMYVEEALGSLIRTPDGMHNLNQVVSPALGGQDGWVYSYYYYYYYDYYKVENFRAYWAFVESPDTLAGFIFTPMPVSLPIEPEADDDDEEYPY